MKHRYKRYSKGQLQADEGILQKKLKEAEQAGKRNYVAVHRRKIEIVRSYMLNPEDLKPGAIHTLTDDPEPLHKLAEVRAVVAWGDRRHSETEEVYEDREAVLIALLGGKVVA